jgi:hypothetical protein
MKRSASRPTAFAAILAVAWTALWPLVSSAHALLAAETPMLCHQAGSLVAPDEAPVKPDAPPAEGKVHCPLCIFAFFGAPVPALDLPREGFSMRVATVRIFEPPHPQDSQLSLPPSRAPPEAFAAFA